MNILCPLLLSVFIFIIVMGAIKLWRYEKILKEKDLKVIQFYLDKKFLHNQLTKNFEFPPSQNYILSFLENIKFYFKLDDIRIISQEELAEDKELSFLFKQELEDSISSFLASTKKEITAFQVLNAETNTDKPNSSHQLYVYLSKDKINQPNLKNLIYVKAPYIFNKDERETMDIYLHLAKILFE